MNSDPEPQSAVRTLPEQAEWLIKICEDSGPSQLSAAIEALKKSAGSAFDLNSFRDPHGATLLHHALLHGRADMAQELLARGASAKPRFHGQDPSPQHRERTGHWESLGLPTLTLAIQNIQGSELLDLLPALIAAGSRVDDPHSTGTPLHHATREENETAVLWLLARGANPTIAAGNGWTPLHSAAGACLGFEGESGESGVALRALLKAGANPNAQEKRGQTPLHMVAQVSAQEGKTPSTEKIAMYERVAKLLVGAGASALIRDEQGRLPRELAGAALRAWLLRQEAVEEKASLDGCVQSAKEARRPGLRV